uniref:C-type lectin domain-containing protein n=1 Tax=Oryzias latipes TaxID=8090 RepID=A0A3P9JLM9_ORYLA
MNVKPACLVCHQQVAVLKEYNVQHHYETHHKEKFHQLQLRKEKIYQLFISVFLSGPFCIMTNQLLHYHVINENKSWDEAQDYCNNKHTDMATVSSMADMNRLRQLLGNKKAWIGLQRKASSNRMWQWSQPDVQFNESRDNGWDTKEPDNNGIENCGTLNTNKKWADLSCNRKKPFICYDGENQKKITNTALGCSL